jgi:outer membrane usher protein
MPLCKCPSLNRKAVVLALALLSASAFGKHAWTQDKAMNRVLELEVIVNGQTTGMIGEFHERAGRLFATKSDLDSLGFQIAATPYKTTGQELALSSLPGVTYRLDERTQTLFVTAENRALKPTILRAEAAPGEGDVQVRSGLGAAFNYDTVGTHLDGQTLAETAVNGNIFSPWGLLSASGIATSGAESDLPPLLRLATTYSYSDVGTLRQYAAGDFISGGLDWSRPVRMGGLQLRSNFAERPDLVTFPVPTIAGQVAVPSSVDVLVNGVQLLSQTVPSGPFQIPQLPVVTGTGSVSVVTRNAAGQQTVETLPFYSSTLLLKPGLSAYSVEAGAVRLNYGFESDQYGAPAGSLSYRYGVQDWLTLEGHVEAAKGGDDYDGYRVSSGAMGGGGAAFEIGHYAVASVDGAVSEFGGHGGGMLSATVERIAPILSLSGSIQAANKDFADIAAAYGQPVPTLQARASIGLALPHLGSLGLAFVEVQQKPSSVAQTEAFANTTSIRPTLSLNVPSLIPQTHVSLLSASYSRSILDGHAFLYATAFDDLSNTNSAGVMLGMTIPLGDRGSMQASVGGGNGTSSEQLQAMQTANTIGDFGWQSLQGEGGTSQQLATGSYKSRWGLVTAGADRLDGQTAYRGEMQGSIAVADGSLFASNTIYDSFAIVDTDRTKGIEVLQENRPVGKTDASGLMLVPDLRSFDINRVGIDPNDVPPDAEVGNTSQLVRPQDHAGVVVHFPIRVSHGALLHIVDAKGAFVPVGSTAHLTGPTTGEEVAIGYDGEAFVTGLGSRNTVLVTLPNGRLCSVAFDFHAESGRIPEIGPLPCRNQAP